MTPEHPSLEGAPKWVRDFLKDKTLTPSFNWKDVFGEEHAAAFTVAKATSLDVLTAIKEELETSLEQGLPFQAFQKALRPRLEELGWWGQQEMTDPLTGKKMLAQLGSPRRLKTIYEANVRTAYGAGQWERAQSTKTAMPYLMYELGPSEHHREEHANKSGLILPVDDPFWDAWMPPNGWGCKCRVRQITRWEMDKGGKTVDTAPNIPEKTWVNKRTGEVLTIPVGIDPGWHTNPGKTRMSKLQKMLEEKGG